jgi:hypothetical protein
MTTENENEEDSSSSSVAEVLDSDQLKLRIDSNLIRSSTSVLPDELKNLGVLSYTENDFEKGVLHQFNVQLANFELNKTKQSLKRSTKRKSDEITQPDVNEDSNNINFEENQAYLKKKARLESTLKDYNSYLQENENSNSSDSSVKIIQTEKLNEEPTVLHETKPSTSKINPEKKLTKKTDHSCKSVQSEFDLFFNDFEVNRKKKFDKVEASSSKQTGSSTSKISSKPKENTKKRTTIEQSDLVETEFDRFLLNIDNTKQSTSKTTKTPLNLTNNSGRSNSSSEKVTSKTKEANKSRHESAKLDKSTFMRLIDGDNSEDLVDLSRSQVRSEKVESVKKPNKTNRKSAVDSDSDPEFTIEDDDILSDTSSVEYTTDDDEEFEKANRKKSKRTRKNCQDDGDESFYLKRMKDLEKYEATYKRRNYIDDDDSGEMEEELDEQDIEIVNNTTGEEIRPIGLNTGQYFEVDNLLRVPETIWNHLYKFQKVGLKWLWELHTQRCGGILGNLPENLN